MIVVLFPTSPASLLARGIHGTPFFVNETKGEVTLGLLRKLCFVLFFFQKRTVSASAPGKPSPLPPASTVIMVRALCSWSVVSSHHLEDVCLLRRECDQIQRGKHRAGREKKRKVEALFEC